MNDLSLFNFNGHDVRVVMIGDDPWWVASDVRRILGVAQSGSNFAFLSPEEFRPIPRGLASGKGMAQARVLSESGLYKFVLRSDKLQARAFQDWVTREVLPSIRKDGSYVLGEEKVRTGEMTEDELVLAAMEAQRRKIECLVAERDALSLANAPGPYPPCGCIRNPASLDVQIKALTGRAID